MFLYCCNLNFENNLTWKLQQDVVKLLSNINLFLNIEHSQKSLKFNEENNVQVENVVYRNI